jgi:peptide-methionine (R)-S-oxide reductase
MAIGSLGLLNIVKNKFDEVLHHDHPHENREAADLQENWKALLEDGVDVPTSTAPLELEDGEWRKRLTPDAYDVLRHGGTEYTNTSPLNAENRAGVFTCAGCGLPLFTSAMKFDSGTGWPSFFTRIPGALVTKRDYTRILPWMEYHCARCDAHQGHVFDDGPEPTGLRYCNNGIALRFIPKTRKN